MKKYMIGCAATSAMMALMFAQAALASPQGENESKFNPDVQRPAQIHSNRMAHTSHAQSSVAARKGALICPVTGDKISSIKAAVGKSTYRGKTYYFCCAGCKPRFDKAPARFAKNSAAGKFEKM